MDTVVDSTILERLKKLLTLSRGATGAEAETALAMATKLATKHEIDISSIKLASGEQKKEEMVKDVLDCGARMSVAQKWISWLLQEHFKVNIVYSGSRWSGRRLYFLGRKSDVEFAKYVQDFLKEHMLRSWQYFQKTNKVDTRYRATYFSNFYRGLDQKLTEAKKNAEAEGFAAVAENVRAEVKNSYALTLVDEAAERKSFMSKQFTSLRNAPASRVSIYGNESVSKAGFAAGRATNIARPLN